MELYKVTPSRTVVVVVPVDISHSQSPVLLIKLDLVPNSYHCEAKASQVQAAKELAKIGIP